jgi:hypothetical protein
MSQHKAENLQKFRVSSVVLGAFFMAVAVCSLLGQFDEVEQSKTILPIAAVIVGLALAGSGIRSLLIKK